MTDDGQRRTPPVNAAAGERADGRPPVIGSRPTRRPGDSAALAGTALVEQRLAPGKSILDPMPKSDGRLAELLADRYRLVPIAAGPAAFDVKIYRLKEEPVIAGPGGALEIAYSLEQNEFNGTTYTELRLSDARRPQ